MSIVDPFTHMEEAWKLEANPFPSEAIRRGSEPYSADVFPDETHEFYRKVIRGSVLGGRAISFLWSQGRFDTGYGKTTLMEAAMREVNKDLGADVLRQAGMKEDRLLPVAATYATFNSLNATGLYPVLFDTVIKAAEAPEGDSSLLDKARERIMQTIRAEAATDEGEASEAEEDPDAIRNAIWMTRLAIDPAGVPLRPELLNAFANGGSSEVLQQLAKVSQASRLRNGLQYLDFLITVLAAADINHLFIFVDQLEDLAVNKSIGSAKRSREIGRIRDFLEKEPYASRLHFVFTFHNTAAHKLEPFWYANRLPRFEIASDNMSTMVVLRGLSNDEQVAELVRVYLEDKRLDHVEDDLLPFEPSALSVLREVSDGRVGILLSRTHELLQGAAELGRPRIDGDFANQYFQGAMRSGDEVPSEDSVVSSDVDDILLA